VPKKKEARWRALNKKMESRQRGVWRNDSDELVDGSEVSVGWASPARKVRTTMHVGGMKARRFRYPPSALSLGGGWPQVAGGSGAAATSPNSTGIKVHLAQLKGGREVFGGEAGEVPCADDRQAGGRARVQEGLVVSGSAGRADPWS